LTKRIRQKKQEGRLHEIEYNVDFLKQVNINVTDAKPFISVGEKELIKVKKILTDSVPTNIDGGFIVIHPGASCPSKRWMSDRFASLADELRERLNLAVVIIISEKQAYIAERVISLMRYKPFVACGWNLKDLAALLKLAVVLISNDSGPVHIASAVGTPVVSIFSRNQPGLSPRRWGPWDKNSIVIHKDIGCKDCLAHNCQREFLCLREISVANVLAATLSIIKQNHSIKHDRQSDDSIRGDF
jgi:ADP-heptose:LPS heptosyltransferase